MGFLILFSCITKVMVPDYFTDTDYPVTVSRRGFYALENNTADVLFFGSSSGTTSFIPQELYNSYGITSYNLSCEQQSLLTTYYWLCEALDSQSPKAVILEPRMLFPSYPDSKINSTEGAVRKAIDSMKWSLSKARAILDICSMDQEQSALGYFFPIVRYHSRWSSLTKKDFPAYYSAMKNGYELKGYDPFNQRNQNESWAPYREGSTAQCAEEFPGMGGYLDKIIGLCKEKGIVLILAYIPCGDARIEKHNTLQRYADANDLRLIDFNEADTYNASGFVFTEDSTGGAHPNLRGAKKLTDYIGEVLRSEYHISGREDAQWEETRQAYEDIREDFALQDTTEIDEYLSLLSANRGRYDILISARDDASAGLKDSTVRLFEQLGLHTDLKNRFRSSYIAVLTPDTVTEKCGYEQLSMKGRISALDYLYTVTSGGYEHGNVSSIVLNGSQLSKNGRGLNFVVFDERRMKVIDRVCFDTYTEENTASR